MNLNHNPRGGTICLSKAGLGIGSTPAELSIAAPNGAGIDFAIDGIVYHLADDATVVMAPTDEDGTTISTQAALKTCLYLVELDSSGALTTKKGTEVLTADYVAGTAVLKWPNASADKCPIGAVMVATGAATTYTAATTDLDASLVTDTYIDLTLVPPHPKTYA